MLLSAPVFLVVAWREAARGVPLGWRDWAGVTVLGLFGYYGASMLDFYGLLYISAGLERLVLFTYPMRKRFRFMQRFGAGKAAIQCRARSDIESGHQRAVGVGLVDALRHPDLAAANGDQGRRQVQRRCP